MRGADFKRDWVQDRINELRGKDRMSYAEIGRRMGGKSRQQIQAIAKGGPVGDDMIAVMCRVFNFEPPHPKGARAVVDNVRSPIDVPGQLGQQVGNDPFAGERAQYLQIIDRLTRRLDDLSALSVKVDQLIREGKLSQ